MPFDLVTHAGAFLKNSSHKCTDTIMTRLRAGYLGHYSLIVSRC